MTENWQWLINTFWYVPSANLKAAMFSADRTEPLWLSDQTVWQITGYKSGYFWGNVAVQLQPESGSGNDQPPAAQRVMASVTPEGTLHMTFASLDSSSSSAAVIGIGKMTWRDGAWTAEMQMSTAAANGGFILHWAYMLQCEPGDAAWQQLPGTDQSLPEFLKAAGFDAGTAG